MLRFINISSILRTQYLKFQYIPCYGLSSCLRSTFVMSLRISIHPMLRFIYSRMNIYRIYFVISIHPMLRFITLSSSALTISSNFNTSHVTVYLNLLLLRQEGKEISIHPMLRFIGPTSGRSGKGRRISIHPMLRFIFSKRFLFQIFRRFQYIPCYGLSTPPPNSLTLGS